MSYLPGLSPFDPIHVGFTGSRENMTEVQHRSFRHLCEIIATGGDVVFHHGDCVGSDIQAGEFAESLDWSIHLHPPEKDDLRAFGSYDVSEKPKPYLRRNKDIVKASAIMIATPLVIEPQNKGGTWWTIKCALKENVTTWVVGPAGEVVLAHILMERYS